MDVNGRTTLETKTNNRRDTEYKEKNIQMLKAKNYISVSLWLLFALLWLIFAFLYTY